MIKKILQLVGLVLVLPAVFATTYYLQIINPNDYDLTDFQIKVNLTEYNITTPVAQITTLDGTNVPFCYEQSNGECNQTESEVIWLKVPYIPAKDYAVVKIIVNGTNGAVHGDYVFDFYDDFQVLDVSKWTVGGTGTVSVNNSILTTTSTDSVAAYVQSTKSFNMLNKIVEVRALLGDTTTTRYESGIHIQYDVNNRVNIWSEGEVAGYNRIVSERNGVIETTDPAWPVSQSFVVYTIIFTSSGVIFKRSDSTTEYTHSAINYAYSYPIWLGDFAADANYGTGEFDWIRVRKYADQDPVVRYGYQGSFSEGAPTQTSTEYNQTYQYVRQINVLPENSVSISNAQLIIELDTKSLIANGKMQSDCSDIYVTYYDPLYGELPAKFWVDPTTCNSKATRIYVKIPTVSINNDWIVNVYYGSPGAIPMWDPKNTFAFYVDLTSPSDISQNLIIRTAGTVTLDYTTSGLVIQTGTDGKVLIVNK